MPTPEQQVNQTPEAFEGMPETSERRLEQRFRTIAVRVHENLHSQLSFIAQLSGTSISEEIRTALEHRIATAQDDPDLIAKAQQVREEIEREAAVRAAAIAGFMGQSTVASAVTKPETATVRTRRTTKTTNE